MSAIMTSERPLLRERAIRIGQAPWLISALAVVVLLIALTAISGQGPWGILTANMQTASFIAIVALAQMLVITTGNGAIDLSIPSGVTLAVYVVTLLQQGEDGRLWYAALLTLLVGAVVGAVNGLIVTLLRVPAIVATLAIGFIIDSVVNMLSTIPGRSHASHVLQDISKSTLFGIPYVALIAIVVGGVVAIFLWRTSPGLRLIATGQNAAAAKVSGLGPQQSRFRAFVLSGLLTAFAGILISGFSNGAFLGVGEMYLIASIAAVVLGGTLIAGGKSTVVGCLVGALFLTLIVALTNVLTVPVGIRWLVEGLIILAALAIRSQRKSG